MFFNKEKRILKKMGFYSDQKGIINRYLRENGSWDSHLKNSKDYIINYINTLENTNSVAILGSGWLLDVPIKELTNKFKKVYLFDIVHPKEIIQKMKRYANVELVLFDISGGCVNSIYNLLESKRAFNINDIVVNGFNYKQDFDLTVSLNILNQLDILISDFVKSKKLFSESEILKLKKKIQVAHLDSLKERTSLLITDFEEITKIEGKKKVKSLLFSQLPKGGNIQKWKWKFDLTKNYNPESETVFNVIALEMNNPTANRRGIIS